MRPLRPAILYGIDTRSAGGDRRLSTAPFGIETIIARSGSTLSSQALGPKLLWLRRNEPEIWEPDVEAWYDGGGSFVARRPHGRVRARTTTPRASAIRSTTSSGATMGRGIGQMSLVPGVPLPERRAGPPTRGWSCHGGGGPLRRVFRKGTPVVAGTVDAWAEAFSVGVRRPWRFDVHVRLDDVLRCGRPDGRGRHQLLWSTQGVERRFAGSLRQAGVMSTSGSLTEWVRGGWWGTPIGTNCSTKWRRCRPDRRGLLLLPYFAGERTPVLDPLARGVVAGLTLRHGRAELLRATYEATGFAARQILELLPKLPARRSG